MKMLLQLFNDNRRAPGKACESKVIVAQSDGDETIVYLYDPIVGDRMLAEWYGYVCAQDLVPQIDDIKSGTMRLKINCPGGDVFAMQAIMNAIRAAIARGVKAIAQVDGVAASAATGIASVCESVVMEKGALWMVHNSQGMCFGDKNDMREMAVLQDKVDAGMVEAYVSKTGATSEKVIAWMDAETWFTAEEAVTAGFADSVNSGAKVEAVGEWNLSAFANAPKATKTPAPSPSPAPAPIAQPEPDYINAEHRERQAQRVRTVAALLQPSPAPHAQ